MRRIILWILFVISLLFLLWLVFQTTGQDDSWVCSNGQWVKGKFSFFQSDSSCLEAKPSVVVEPAVVEPQASAAQIFFGNTQKDPETLNCNLTYGATRQIVFGSDKYTAVLAALLEGPTAAEKKSGFFTTINPNLKTPQITLTNGVLRVNFAADFEQAVGGSCRVAAIRSQITNTLKQFPEVKEVIISVEGRVEDVLQP